MSRAPLNESSAPPRVAELTLANWQDAPYNRWSFQHVREVIPTQRISRGTGPVTPVPRQQHPPALDEVTVHCVDGRTSTFGDVLADTWTDAVVILHHGCIVHERYANGMAEDTPHLLMSVSKSVVGCVAGILVEQGVLDPQAQAATYAPEIVGTGYDGATVRHLLDMRTGVAFREEYTDRDAEVRVMERHMGWRPTEKGDRPAGVYGYLATLGTHTDHGGPFVYRSADTDMLGWVCERAGGARMADLISLLLWQPMGAEFDADITCDALGTAVHDGGMSARARDVARFGQLLLDDGHAHGTAIVPARWLHEARTLVPEVRRAFAASESEPFLTGGWYRNQFWFLPGPLGELQLCLGIHGQLVLIDRATRTVWVKMSSWPTAQNPAYLLDTIRAFVAAGRHLAGLDSAEDVSSTPSTPCGAAG